MSISLVLSGNVMKKKTFPSSLLKYSEENVLKCIIQKPTKQQIFAKSFRQNKQGRSSL